MIAATGIGKAQVIKIDPGSQLGVIRCGRTVNHMRSSTHFGVAITMFDGDGPWHDAFAYKRYSCHLTAWCDDTDRVTIADFQLLRIRPDRKSTRLNSSH